MDEAKQLLKQSNLTVSEISFAVGYQDASHFSGLFRKYNGVTPQDYRSLVRSKVFKVAD